MENIYKKIIDTYNDFNKDYSELSDALFNLHLAQEALEVNESNQEDLEIFMQAISSIERLNNVTSKKIGCLTKDLFKIDYDLNNLVKSCRRKYDELSNIERNDALCK